MSDEGVVLRWCSLEKIEQQRKRDAELRPGMIHYLEHWASFASSRAGTEITEDAFLGAFDEFENEYFESITFPASGRAVMELSYPSFQRRAMCLWYVE